MSEAEIAKAGRGGFKTPIRLMLAIEDEAEREALAGSLQAALPASGVSFPANIAEVEAIYSADGADAIVTDFRFHGGALADWLTFWPLPSVILVDEGDDPGRISASIRDEAALFLERRPRYAHARTLPLLVRKALNIRESVVRQNAHIQLSERQYLSLLQAVPDIVYILDGGGRFIFLNESVRALGFDPAKLIGEHFSAIVDPLDVQRVSRAYVLPALAGKATGSTAAPKLFDERRTGDRMTRNLEVRLRHGDGAARVGCVTAYGEVSASGFALPEFQGGVQGTVGIVRDVSLRKLHEIELVEALAAKETLLKEIHHRVKNNLQVVSSLLNLHGSGLPEIARRVLGECQTQIQSMAMVHEELYRAAGEEGIEMRAYFERLMEYLSTVYEGPYRGISWRVDAEGGLLGLDQAIPTALVVCELASNCYKHAFPGNSKGTIEIRMRRAEGSWLVEVEDDGVGVEVSRAVKSDAGAAGIGTDLVAALAAQLRGSASSSPGRGGAGTLRALSFPVAKPAPAKGPRAAPEPALTAPEPALTAPEPALTAPEPALTAAPEPARAAPGPAFTAPRPS